MAVSPADSVRLAVQSSSTCSSSTVLLLQRLLQGPQDVVNEKAKVADAKVQKSTRRTQTSARSKTTRTTKCRSKTTATTSISTTTTEVEVGNGPQLTHQEKLLLATEVFNSTSKALSQALKANPTRSQNKAVEPQTPLRRAAQDKLPLQPCSPNRITPSPANSKSTQTNGSGSATEDAGILAVAESARLALSCLRSLKGKQVDGNELQLEQASCILAGRLIALGCRDLAHKELRQLKRRIQAYLDKDANDDADRAAPADLSKETLADLIRFENTDTKAQMLGLMVSFQSHALKLIATERKAATVQKVSRVLSLSEASSPANIILKASKSGGSTSDKAAQQLQSLSSVILSMCPAGSSTKTQVKPMTILDLQVLSLEVRLLWWKLAGHKCDEAKELWEPLVQYLATFMRRCGEVNKDDYATISKAFGRLKSTVTKQDYEVSTTPESKKCHTAVLRLLGQIAQQAGCAADAEKLQTQSINLTSGDDLLAQGIGQCKLAAIHLQGIKKGKDHATQDAVKAFAEASKCLSGSLKGSLPDLEELLIESARLKKMSAPLLSGLGEPASLENSEPRSAELELALAIVNYIRGFVTFLKRYLGHPPLHDTEVKECKSFLHRLQKSCNISLAAVDTVTAIGKVAVVSGSAFWEDCTPLFVDSAMLLRNMVLSEGVDECPFNPESQQMGLIKLSNLYWTRFLKRKEQGAGLSELVTLVEKSTTLLRSCSSSKSAGYASIRLERLAMLYAESGHIKRSEAAYIQSIHVHLESGVMERAALEASSKPSPRIWKDTKSDVFMLGRVIAALTRSRRKRRSSLSSAIFDDESLPSDQRALILEWQMSLLVDAKDETVTNHSTSPMPSLISKLLSLYPSDQYPIRRLRIILQSMQLLLSHPSSLDANMAETLVADGLKTLTQLQDDSFDDLSLQGFQAYLSSSFRLTIGFYSGSMAVEDIQSILSVWVSITLETGDWESLEAKVEDPVIWTLQMKSLVDFVGMRGMWKLKLSALALLQRILELQPQQDFSALVSCLSEAGLQYSRLGYSSKAGCLLARAQHHVQRSEASPLSSILLYLAYGEYLIGIGDLDKSAETLGTAQVMYEQHWEEADISRESTRSKLAWERLVANASHLQSMLAFARGDLFNATFFAKQQVKLNARLWAKLERLVGRNQDKPPSGSHDSEVGALADKIERIDLSSDNGSQTSYQEGALFWPHVLAHHSALMNLSKISAHNGLFQDAIYYGEQALKVSKAIGASTAFTLSQAQLGEQWARGGHYDQAEELLDVPLEGYHSLGGNTDTVLLHTQRATFFNFRKDLEAEQESLEAAHQLLLEMSEQNAMEACDPLLSALDLEKEMQQLSLGSKTRPKSRVASQQQQARKTTRTTRSKATSVAKTSRAAKQPANSHDTDFPPLLRLRGDVLREKASRALRAKKFAEARSFLEEASEHPKSVLGHVSQALGFSEQLVSSAIRSLATHAVYCVLPESTISLPSIWPSNIQARTRSPLVTPETDKPSTGRRTKTPTRGARARVPEADGFMNELANARTAITEICSAATASCSTRDVHYTSYLLTLIFLLSSATSSQSLGLSGSLLASYSHEFGRIVAGEREEAAILADKHLSGSTDPLQWPSKPRQISEPISLAASTFVKDYVDILPTDWTVISLSISMDHNELIVSKLHTGQSPFFLRLPLKRGSAEGVDEEEFGFEEAKKELAEIIESANTSAHDARTCTNRDAKKEWWATREALDLRLKDLLSNMENVWLGGFRGVFSPHPRHPELLSRFSSSFQKVLDKHLPSRQKGGKSTNPEFIFDRNVMELFLGIECLDDESEPEEVLMDLLYFVVDILQFQGERNAYDEIDFDMLVIDTLDALRSYQEAAREEGLFDHSNHTILVLDKSLHAFPWESMPCLRGKSVSRMSSLGGIRDRVMQMQEQDTADSGRFWVNRANGSYILNPSGDLASTQSAFERSLSSFGKWTGIVNRAPAEEEFKHALESRDLMLYFGHGSGAQFIRGRTIKRLDRCAVTFLMGCSSGRLTEAGEYESYGTPVNYMQAGAPALVATLWDVTDKDIDRFAQSAFAKWGLAAEQAEEYASTSKKGRSKKARQTSSSALSLNEAVAQSRDTCVLPYLNGAAPVVYGVPVFLK